MESLSVRDWDDESVHEFPHWKNVQLRISLQVIECDEGLHVPEQLNVCDMQYSCQYGALFTLI